MRLENFFLGQQLVEQVDALLEEALATDGFCDVLVRPHCLVSHIFFVVVVFLLLHTRTNHSALPSSTKNEFST